MSDRVVIYISTRDLRKHFVQYSKYNKKVGFRITEYTYDILEAKQFKRALAMEIIDNFPVYRWHSYNDLVISTVIEI